MNGPVIFIQVLFGLTVIGTILWFYAACRSKKFLVIIVSWAILQSIVGLLGFYQETETIPPRLMLFGVFPTLILIAAIFLTKSGKAFLDGINLKTLTYFHTIRLPVEIVLLLLYHQNLVSVYMTFEGTNFDLISGISAPVAAFYAFRGGRGNKKFLIGWNILCLLLLFNVVITAILALPSPFQVLSLNQPNVAVLYFPFNLLPAVVVPTVLFGHLAAFRKLRVKS